VTNIPSSFCHQRIAGLGRPGTVILEWPVSGQEKSLADSGRVPTKQTVKTPSPGAGGAKRPNVSRSVLGILCSAVMTVVVLDCDEPTWQGTDRRKVVSELLGFRRQSAFNHDGILPTE
jgi:hypothetical protein